MRPNKLDWLLNVLDDLHLDSPVDLQDLDPPDDLPEASFPDSRSFFSFIIFPIYFCRFKYNLPPIIVQFFKV